MGQLNFERRGKQWYITQTWPYTIDCGESCNEYGPYQTKDELLEAMRSVARTMKEIVEDGLHVGQDDTATAAGANSEIFEAAQQKQLALAFD
jgi:hypothetical protein